MDRAAYNACMSKGLTGRKLTKEERKSEFCIVAKTCSGKAKDRAEAQKMCAESAAEPKEEKAPRTKRVKKIDYADIKPMEIKIKGETYMLPPEEFGRICPCILKAGSKNKAKAALAESRMRE